MFIITLSLYFSFFKLFTRRQKGIGSEEKFLYFVIKNYYRNYYSVNVTIVVCLFDRF